MFKDNKNKQVEKVVKEESINQQEVEDINETKIEEPIVKETKVEESIDEIDIQVIGIVSNCKLLNIRSKPNIDSDILSVIPVDSILTITDVNASSDFYKVLIGDLEGFAMKQFIKIKE